MRLCLGADGGGGLLMRDRHRLDRSIDSVFRQQLLLWGGQPGLAASIALHKANARAIIPADTTRRLIFEPRQGGGGDAARPPIDACTASCPAGCDVLGGVGTNGWRPWSVVALVVLARRRRAMKEESLDRDRR